MYCLLIHSFIFSLPLVTKTCLPNHQRHMGQKDRGRRLGLWRPSNTLTGLSWNFWLLPFSDCPEGRIKRAGSNRPERPGPERVWAGAVGNGFWGEETQGKGFSYLLPVLRKRTKHDFFLSSAWKQMFLCLSSLGLISLLSFSEFSLFICKWKTSERLVSVGVGVGGGGVAEAEVFIFKATGVPIWKSTQLISMFLFVWFWIKRLKQFI